MGRPLASVAGSPEATLGPASVDCFGAGVTVGPGVRVGSGSTEGACDSVGSADGTTWVSVGSVLGLCWTSGVGSAVGSAVGAGLGATLGDGDGSAPGEGSAASVGTTNA